MSDDEDADIPTESTESTDFLDVHQQLLDEAENTSKVLYALKLQLEESTEFNTTVEKFDEKISRLNKTAKKLHDKKMDSGLHYDIFYNALTDLVDVKKDLIQLRWLRATEKKTRFEHSSVSIKIIACLMRHTDTLEKIERSMHIMYLLNWVIESVRRAAASTNEEMPSNLRTNLEETLVSLSGTKDTDLVDEFNDQFNAGRMPGQQSDSGAKPSTAHSTEEGGQSENEQGVSGPSTKESGQPDFNGEQTTSDPESTPPDTQANPKKSNSRSRTSFDIDINQSVKEPAEPSSENEQEIQALPRNNSSDNDSVFNSDISHGLTAEIFADIDKLIDGGSLSDEDKVEEEERFPPDKPKFELPEEDKISLPDSIGPPPPIEWTPDLHFAIGVSYWTGDIAGSNYAYAYHHLRIALKEKKMEACYYLGKMYSAGQGVGQDLQTAFNMFIRGAKSGDAKCLYEAGFAFEFGVGVTRNVERSCQFYEAALAKDNVPAKTRVGYHKLFGIFYETNLEEAVDLLEAAAGKVDENARAYLAVCFARGIEYEQNLKKAKELLTDASEPSFVGRHGRATKPGSRAAILLLAQYYEEGMFGEVDKEQAAKLYKQLTTDARWKYDSSYAYYGRCLLHGIGVEQNTTEGMEMVRESTAAHYSDAWAVLGICYRDGVGVERDIEMALKYLNEATVAIHGERGIVEAHYALACMFHKGDGVDRDEMRAVHHYLSAADRLHTEAQFRVAQAFEKGKGVEQNNERAYYYFNLAAKAGHPLAQRKAGEKLMRGLGVRKCLISANYMLREAAYYRAKRARRLLLRTMCKQIISGNIDFECECCPKPRKPQYLI